MTAPNLTPGTYRLTADVKNPNADRRVHTDWRAEPTWTAGQVFVVVQTPRGAIEVCRAGQRLAFTHTQVITIAPAALLAALTPMREFSLTAENTRLAIVGRWSLSGISVFDLIEAGAVSPEVGMALLATYERRIDETDEA